MSKTFLHYDRDLFQCLDGLKRIRDETSVRFERPVYIQLAEEQGLPVFFNPSEKLVVKVGKDLCGFFWVLENYCQNLLEQEKIYERVESVYDYRQNSIPLNCTHSTIFRTETARVSQGAVYQDARLIPVIALRGVYLGADRSWYLSYNLAECLILPAPPQPSLLIK